MSLHRAFRHRPNSVTNRPNSGRLHPIPGQKCTAVDRYPTLRGERRPVRRNHRSAIQVAEALKASRWKRHAHQRTSPTASTPPSGPTCVGGPRVEAPSVGTRKLTSKGCQIAWSTPGMFRTDGSSRSVDICAEAEALNGRGNWRRAKSNWLRGPKGCVVAILGPEWPDLAQDRRA